MLHSDPTDEVLATQQKAPRSVNAGIIIFSLAFFLLLSSKIFAQLTYNELTVEYDSAWTFKKLQLIPIRFKGPADHANFLKGGIMSFEQAMREGKITVKESTLPGGADVRMLTIKNHSKKNILIRSGEMVSGGKQDRAFAITTILPPEEKENYVPVFCIEKGRWEDKNKAFHYAGTAEGDLRRVIDESAQQRKVWDEVNRILSEKDIKNKTWAYLEAYADTTKADTAYTHFFNRKIQYSDSAYAGFIAIIGKRIIDCQIFCSSDFCMLSYESLVRSYVHSIRGDDVTPKITVSYLKKFTDKFLQNAAQQQKYLARHGRMYVYNGNIVQIVAYDD